MALRWESHYGTRVVRCFADRPANLNDAFAASVVRAPDAEALVDGARRLSFADLDRQVARVAGGLAEKGVSAGDRVALLLGNCAEFVVALLAVLRLGAVAVPLNTREQTPELAFVLGDCGARVLIHEASLVSRLPPASDTPSLVHTVPTGTKDSGFVDMLATSPLDHAPEVTEDSAAMILYTSGTTGKPKGAILTHLSIVTTMLHFQHCWSLTHEERAIIAVPLTHVTGMTALLFTMLLTGGSVILLASFKADAFLRLAAAERMTYTLMVPAMYNLCLLQTDITTFDLSSWRVGGFGGAPMPPATVASLAAALPSLVLVNAYGATETSAPATLTPPDAREKAADTVGLPLPCADILVMDENGREAAAGEAGEIWIGGSMVAAGYWQNDAATMANFVGGYWRSGDIGAFTKQGFLRVFDRRKDMINRGGYKVYSVEVEHALSHHSGIAECAVIGVPDPVLGEKTRVVIYRTDPNLTAEAVRTWCSGQLSDYKVPDFVTFVDGPLPRNANGKLMKRALRMVEER